MKYKRGDIYYANLGIGKGSEQNGTRPIVIIQNNIGNENSTTVIVAVITTKIKKLSEMPTKVFIPKEEGLLDRDSVIMCEQIKTIDKKRLFDYRGTLKYEYIKNINKAIKISLGLKENRNLINIERYKILIEKLRNETKIDREKYTDEELFKMTIIAAENLDQSGNIELTKEDLINYIKMLDEKFSVEQMKRQIKNRF